MLRSQSSKMQPVGPHMSGPSRGMQGASPPWPMMCASCDSSEVMCAGKRQAAAGAAAVLVVKYLLRTDTEDLVVIRSETSYRTGAEKPPYPVH